MLPFIELIAPFPPVCFLVPLTVGLDFVHRGWHCSLGSDDLNCWLCLLVSDSSVPFGLELKWMVLNQCGRRADRQENSVWVDRTVALIWCEGCLPLSLPCGQSLLPKVAQAFFPVIFLEDGPVRAKK